MIRVAVIGGGLSGTLCAMRLLMRSGRHMRITLVERRSRQVNRGVAYSARLSQQLLNVPAKCMSLFPERPDDLLDWARSGPMPHVGADEFLPRMLYGDHISDRFNELREVHRGQVNVVHAAATGLEHHPAHGYRVLLDNGQVIAADVVVLALGNAPPAHVPGITPEAQAHSSYVAWPWQVGALDGILPTDEVFFAGAGLTMADLLLSLDDLGHAGPITVLSRSGRMPLPHVPLAPYRPRQALPQAPFTVLGLMGWLRREAALAATDGLPWQQVLDHVKAYVQQWWMGMDRTERERFLRHARPFWEIHRHRMPSAVRDRSLGLVDAGRVRFMAGRVISVQPDQDHLRVTVRHRGEVAPTVHRVRHLINCTGPQADTRRLDQPLIADMLAKGFVSWDPLHLGLATTPEGALVDGAGRAAGDLFAIGPLCKATLWENTAVPEIRVQARALAEYIEAHRKSLQLKGWRYWMIRLSDRVGLVDA